MTHTLPGTIPGLLRRCSPVVIVGDFWLEHDLWPAGSAGVVRDVGQEDVEVTLWHEDHGHATVALIDAAFALDLTDPTGRAHAAWWLRAIIPRGAYDERIYPGDPDDADAALDAALDAIECEPMRPDQIDTLRRACLAVAGLTP